MPQAASFRTSFPSDDEALSIAQIARSRAGAGRWCPYTSRAVIYCVVPPELEGELHAKLVDYYEANPDVTVILDRRRSRDRREAPAASTDAHAIRERRRTRIPGTFPAIEAP
jgi:hypothetical protein